MVLLYILSFKKSNNEAQEGQSMANVTDVNPSDAGIASTPSYVLFYQSGSVGDNAI